MWIVLPRNLRPEVSEPLALKPTFVRTAWLQVARSAFRAFRRIWGVVALKGSI